MLIGKPGEVGATQPSSRSAATSGARSVPADAAGAIAGGENRVEGPEPSGSVQLSDASRALLAAAEGGEEFRADKVAQLKKAIEDGHYQVRATKLADQMIREASELIESLASTK